MKTDIYLKDIPKLSLNKLYAGVHWTKRKKIKDDYSLIVLSQLRNVRFKDAKKYHCVYHFSFKNNALDVTNCAAMVKMIEDCLFDNDSPEIIPFIGVYSEKAKQKEAVNLWLEVYEL